MAKFFDVHAANPEPRVVAKTVDALRDGAVIAYPTDTTYALGCALDNADGLDRIRRIRGLGDKHHFTLMCADMTQLGRFAFLTNSTFRRIRAVTPGPYAFIVPASKEVPRRMMHPKKKTVGVRIAASALVQDLVAGLDEPFLTTTLVLPGEEEPPTSGWEVKEALDHSVDIVLDAGEVGTDVSTVVDFSGHDPVVLRVGAGDPEPFE